MSEKWTRRELIDRLLSTSALGLVVYDVFFKGPDHVHLPPSVDLVTNLRAVGTGKAELTVSKEHKETIGVHEYSETVII